MAIISTGPLMLDLTAPLLVAAGRQGDWSWDSLRSLLAQVADRLPQLETSWDWDAGEEWALVYMGADVVGMVHARLPFAIVAEAGPPGLLEVVQTRVPIVATAPDFESEVFAIDRGSLSTIFPASRWEQKDWAPPSELSMHDIYYHTV